MRPAVLRVDPGHVGHGESLRGAALPGPLVGITEPDLLQHQHVQLEILGRLGNLLREERQPLVLRKKDLLGLCEKFAHFAAPDLFDPRWALARRCMS